MDYLKRLFKNKMNENHKEEEKEEENIFDRLNEKSDNDGGETTEPFSEFEKSNDENTTTTTTTTEKEKEKETPKSNPEEQISQNDLKDEGYTLAEYAQMDHDLMEEVREKKKLMKNF